MMKKIEWKNYANYIVVAIFTLVFGIMSLTGSVSSSNIYLLEKIAISIILAVSLSMVVGFLGELSLGHAGFMCVGAYLGGKVAVLLQPILGNGIVTLIIALLVGGGIAALCGVVIGLPALRLRGDYLAIVTLAFGEIVKSIFMNSSRESFGGSLGLDTPRYSKDTLFIIAFVLVILCLAAVQNIIRSKHGRAITAIRDNEIAAKATGINVTKYKLIVFTVSSFFAGIAGVLYSYSNYTVQSMKFGYNYSIEILVMVVLGGMGSINGSIIAASLITFLDVWLQTKLTGNLAVLQDFLYALILIVLVIYNNAPALKGFREKYNYKALIRYYVSMWRNYSNFKGRTERGEFWGAIIVDNFIGMCPLLPIFILAASLHKYQIMAIVCLVVYVLFALGRICCISAIMIRRLHDIGLSGHWLWMIFVPVIGAIALFIMFCRKGTLDANVYGDVPGFVDRNHDPAKRREDEAKWDRVPTKIEMNEVLSVDLQVNNYTPDKGKKEEQ